MSQEEFKNTTETIEAVSVPAPFDPHDAERIKELNAKFEGIKEEEKQEQLKRFGFNVRSAVDAISSRTTTMFDALHERLQGQLTPVQSEEHFQAMVTGVGRLKQFDGTVDQKKITELTDNINNLTRLFTDMEQQRTSVLRESKENLEKLAYGAKSFSMEAEDGARKLQSELLDAEMEGKRKELQDALMRLSNESMELYTLAATMRSRFG